MFKYIKANVLLIALYWLCSGLILFINDSVRFLVYFIAEICILPLAVANINYKLAKSNNNLIFIAGLLGTIAVILLGHTFSYYILSRYYYRNDLSLPLEAYWFSAFNYYALIVGIIGCVIAQVLLWCSWFKKRKRLEFYLN